jgi:actin-like ATPase involved in cell morphogenesis
VLAVRSTQSYVIDNLIVKAIDEGLWVFESAGSMVADSQGGTTEVVIISLGAMVYKNSEEMDEDKFDEFMINYVHWQNWILIGEQIVEM